MKRAAHPVPGPGRYTVDAAAKALELLNTFSFNERRLSLSALAERTGIPRATAFRLLSTLEASGFVTKTVGEYQLGLKCFVLGNIVAADLDLKEVAYPHLVALRDATRETTQIAILDHWQVVYLERVPSPQPVGFMRARVGAILPAYCTGLGKTLLAFEPEGEVTAWMSTQTFKALTPHTITSATRLLKQLRGIRVRGYGIDEQEREVGVRCVAAPVRNHEGRSSPPSAPRDLRNACRVHSSTARPPPRWSRLPTPFPLILVHVHSVNTTPRCRRMEVEGEESRTRSDH
jgi:DNA-binding IclR family transcriptional regulator